MYGANCTTGCFHKSTPPQPSTILLQKKKPQQCNDKTELKRERERERERDRERETERETEREREGGGDEKVMYIITLLKKDLDNR